MENKPTFNSKEWEKFVSEFQNTSDRAAAILGASHLQAQLSHILTNFIVDNQATKEKLLGGDKPLESFSTLIEVTYALGLISTNEYHDLQLIEQIRDSLLYGLDEAKFTEGGIEAKCYALKIPRRVFRPNESLNPRRLFVFATALLTQQLSFRISQAERQRRTPPEEFILIDVK
jgi:DNA-binding MltR family transcriptional regulator